MTITAIAAPLLKYLVRLADDNLVLGQRLSEYIASAPEIEEDLAVANIGLAPRMTLPSGARSASSPTPCSSSSHTRVLVS